MKITITTNLTKNYIKIIENNTTISVKVTQSRKVIKANISLNKNIQNLQLVAANNVVYDNSISGLASRNLQDAINELKGVVDSNVGAKTYRFVQNIPSDTWVIDHNLGYKPNVFIEDSAGNQVEGNVQHNSLNRTTVSYSAPFSGAADLS